MAQSFEELEMVILNGNSIQKEPIRTSSDGLHCIGYRTAKDKVALFVLLSILSCGLVLLLSYWKPHWQLRLTSRKTHKASETQWVLLQCEDGSISVVQVIPVSCDDQEDILINVEKSFRRKTGQRKGSDESAQPLLCNETSSWEEKGKCGEEENVRYFVHCYRRFQYNPLTERAIPIIGLAKQTCQGFCESKGLTDEQVLKRREMYGENVAAVEVTPYLHLFVSEVLNPFYVFQWVTVIFWCLDEYYYYSGAILFISFLSLGISLHQTRKQLEELRKMAPEPVHLTVQRNGGHTTVASNELVPGDLVEIPAEESFEMPCDAVLVCGTCRVNESMLTGESTTVTKTELCPSMNEDKEGCGEVTDFSDEEGTSGSHPVYSMTHTEHGGMPTGSFLYDADSPSYKVHTIYCGTTVVGTQPRDGCVLAVVVKTGFSTEKGKLLRSILFPSRINLQFYRDAFRFVGILCIVAATGFAYSCVLFVKYHDGVKELLFRAVDLITTVVPPGLPAAMTVGTIYAVKRLKQHKICCTSPPRVNVSGKIKLVCFDKTGTLTEDNMKMKVVVSYDSQSSQIWRQIKPRNFPSRHINKELIIGMATCHELSNSQSGPAEDIAMFEQTQWILADKNVVRAVPSIGSNSGEQEQYTILSQYPFESGLKRMSVLVHAGSESKSEHLAFAKGAPEVIHGLCRVASRPDEDMLKEELSLWTKQGCRVLAIAYKRVKAEAANGLKRVQIERDLKFLGLLVMTSDLKEMTESVINELQAAKIRTVMVTGDYLDTAVSVAKQCGIILPEDRVVCVEPALGANTVEYRTIASRKQTDVSWNGHCNGNAMSTAADLWNDNDLEVLQSVFAMTGESLRRIRDHCRKVDRSDTGVTELDKALVHGAVFARMGPEEKKTLVEDLQGLGYCVCMCGDGANDCKALRAADAGISLSKAEASVAAPFTSQVADISCVPTLIKEGRTSLVTTFSVFKYMATYSIIEFTTVLMLYRLNSNLGDWQYFYIDLVIVLVLSLVGEKTKPFKGILAKKSPLSSLITFPVLCSLISQITIQLLLLILTYKYMQSEPWFVPLIQVKNTENVKCLENTVLFCLCSFLMINIAVAFAAGPPHRSPVYTNYLFVAAVTVLYVFTAYITLSPADFLVHKFKLDVPNSWLFRVALIEIAILGLVMSSLLEHFIASSNAMKWLHRKISTKAKPKYKEIQNRVGGGWKYVNCS